MRILRLLKILRVALRFGLDEFLLGHERVRLLRTAVCTLLFWRDLSAVGDRSTFEVLGTPNCGKGEPGQVMRVSHGAAPARFRDVEVGVA